MCTKSDSEATYCSEVEDLIKGNKFYFDKNIF